MKTLIFLLLLIASPALADVIHFPEVAGATQYDLQQADNSCQWQFKATYQAAVICTAGACAITVTPSPTTISSFLIAAKDKTGHEILQYNTNHGPQGNVVSIPYQ